MASIKRARKSSGIVGRPTQTYHFDDETEKPKLLVFLKIPADATKSQTEEAICDLIGAPRLKAVADQTDALVVAGVAAVEKQLLDFEQKFNVKIGAEQLKAALEKVPDEKIRLACFQKWLPAAVAPPVLEFKL